MATIKQKPSGRWEAVVEAGRGPNGQRQQLRRRFATKRQATLGAAQLEVEAAAAATTAGESPTLSNYCDWWLAGRRGNLAPKTFASYECVFRNHVAGDPIGKVPLADLSPEDLQAWLLRLADKPGRGGGTLSQQTLLHVYKYLGAALNAAVVRGLLDANPLRLVDAPKVKGDPSKIRAWTADEARRFMTHLAASAAPNARMWRAVFGLVLATGVRRGEIAGLMWRDINLVARTLTVARTRLAGQSDTSPTKTTGSSRTLHLCHEATKYVAELETIRHANRGRLGPAWTDTGFLVVLPDGNPPEPDTITQRMRRDSASAGVPDIGMHGLRHTFATLALSGGVSPHLVTAALGHHDVGFTLRTYAHLLPGAPAEAMATIGELIFGPPATGNVTRSVT